MAEGRQCAYLHALGVDVYVPRTTPALPSEIPVSPMPARSASVAAPPKPAAVAPGRSVSPGRERAVALDHPGKDLDWTSLRAAVAACERCTLHTTRTQTVFGVGKRRAEWLIIGEAPGAEEDRQGEPFVGRAGQLLDAMLLAIGLPRETVFIANVLKCRPPGNRDPKPEEVARCLPYLGQECDACLKACPVPGASVMREGRVVVDEEPCTGCGLCEPVCPTEPASIRGVPRQ